MMPKFFARSGKTYLLQYSFTASLIGRMPLLLTYAMQTIRLQPFKYFDTIRWFDKISSFGCNHILLLSDQHVDQSFELIQTCSLLFMLYTDKFKSGSVRPHPLCLAIVPPSKDEELYKQLTQSSTQEIFTASICCQHCALAICLITENRAQPRCSGSSAWHVLSFYLSQNHTS